MFKLKHKLPAMVVGMAAGLVFGAESAGGGREIPAEEGEEQILLF